MFCFNCGNGLQNNVKFCVKCGVKIETASSNVETEPKSDPRYRKVSREDEANSNQKYGQADIDKWSRSLKDDRNKKMWWIVFLLNFIPFISFLFLVQINGFTWFTSSLLILTLFGDIICIVIALRFNSPDLRKKNLAGSIAPLTVTIFSAVAFYL
ncbi:MAG: zinc ribbon domain-containing protein [Defluviitaleaceae bacterium]|nr:zinc ribbon domain-containing protein [Defluviitaleaceae bacterium]